MAWFKAKERTPAHRVCVECGVFVSPDRAQKIRGTYGDYFYCQVHRRPYDEVYSGFGDGGPTYYRKFEVDANGVPLGYKPKR